MNSYTIIMTDENQGTMDRYQAHNFYSQAMQAGDTKQIMRELAVTDLFFLLIYVFGREDADNDFVYDRCKQVQEEPDDCLDLWARGHYKSTIITFALTIQELLKNPEITIVIFSFTRPIAKGFLRQIKSEFERNEKLHWLFPEICWQDPKKEAPKWSEDTGLQLKRQGNPKEQTIEAWGIIDGQPTSKHFDLLIYDDIVSQAAVSSPEQIAKTTESWELSLNLKSRNARFRYIGTRWAFKDTYHSMIDRGAVTPRLMPATVDGTEKGDPVFLTKAELKQERKRMGPRVFNAQMLQNPNPDNARGFDIHWLKYWRATEWSHLNRYIIVDPANSKKKTSDFTTIVVWGLGADRNYYVITWLRDRLNLTERKNALFRLHAQYNPIAVGYEQYGMQSDVQAIEDAQERENYRFPIIPLGGKLQKEDRIERLVPTMEQGRVYIPEVCIRKNYEGIDQDLTKVFIDEMTEFPFSDHDDMLDSMCRIHDEKLGVLFPTSEYTVVREELPYDPLTYGLEESLALL